MGRQTLLTIILGTLLALLTFRFMGGRNRMRLMKMGASTFRQLRRNLFMGRAFTRTMARQLMRGFQWAR